MTDPEEINQQQELLQIYRRNLAYLIKQQAQQGGPGYAHLSVSNAIFEMRNSIRRVKTILRSWEMKVVDHPDDEEQGASQAQFDINDAVARYTLLGEELILATRRIDRQRITQSMTYLEDMINQSDINTIAKDAIKPIKKSIFSRYFALLIEEYEAVNEEINYTLGAAERLRLNRLADSLEKEMTRYETLLESMS